MADKQRINRMRTEKREERKRRKEHQVPATRPDTENEDKTYRREKGKKAQRQKVGRII